MKRRAVPLTNSWHTRNRANPRQLDTAHIMLILAAMYLKDDVSSEPRRSIADVKAHVVRYGEFQLILWIDLGAVQMQSTVMNHHSIDETFKALTRWSNYMEPRWRSRAD